MRIKKENFENKIICGDASWVLKKIPDKSVDLIITSPPYFGCREYDLGTDALGREENPRDYIKNIVDIIHKTYPVLKDTGSLYLNLGDIYFGTKGFSRNKGKYQRQTDDQYTGHKIAKEDGKYLQHKQRLLLPQRIAIAMQDLGWILRNNIIWEKNNALPCHANDRRLPVHENIFHFVKQKKYFYNGEKAKELDQYRDVIRCPIEPFKDHLATFPEKLITPLIDISCPENGVVLDPFLGAGTTTKAASDMGRKYIGIELNYEYCLFAQKRIKALEGIFSENRDTEIVFRKTAPKTIICSKCGVNKKITNASYWKKFVDQELFNNSYMCEKCISV